MKVFISYKSEEKKEALQIRSFLEENEIECWMAPESIKAGEDYSKAIEDALNSCDALVLMLSKKSQQSFSIKNEVDIARSKGKIVVPYKIEECKLTNGFDFMLRNFQWVDGFKKGGQEKLAERLANSKIIKQTPKCINQYLYGCIAVLAVVLMVVVVVGITGKNKQETTMVEEPNHEQDLLQSDIQQTEIEQQDDEYSAELYKSCTYDLFDYGISEDEIETSRFSTKLDEYREGVCLASFIRNRGTKKSTLEEVSFEVTEVVPIGGVDLWFFGEVIGDTLKIAVANNDYGRTDAASVTIHFQPCSEKIGIELLGEFSEVISFAIEGEEIIGLYDYKLDLEAIEKWCLLNEEENKTKTYLGQFEIEDNSLNGSGYNPFICLTLVFDKALGTYIEQSGLGNDAPESLPTLKLFGILDVDEPATIEFPREMTSVFIEDSIRIEMVIAATKSCKFSGKAVFSINGKQQESPEFHVEVFCKPYYFMNGEVLYAFLDDSGDIDYDPTFTRELLSRDDMAFDNHPSLTNYISETRKYHPEDVKMYFGNNGE